jgi:hypothetical protein
MTQSSYEIVRRAIEFDGPERLPLNHPSLEKSDIALVRWNYVGTGDRNQRETYDEWGCLWVRSENDNMGQVKGHPLADWSDLAQFQWPDPDNPAFYEGMAERLEKATGKYVSTVIFMLLFERMWALHGFENTLTDLYLERENIETLANRIVTFNLGIIRNISQRFPGQVHGLLFSEDWGTQQALMINPDLWREVFKPRYVQIFDAIHQAGWHVWMHSDGRINAILEDLIEIGVNVINLQQPHVVGIEKIGRKFRGRICFQSSCDIQKTLPSKSATEIEAEARLLLHHWASPQGGFIIDVDAENETDLRIPPQNIQVMVDAFQAADPTTKI